MKDIKAFYGTPLGAVVGRSLRERVHSLWPEVGCGAKLARPEYVAGIGYALPYLLPFMQQEAPECSSHQLIGVLPKDSVEACEWPKGKQNRVITADMLALPFADEMLNRVLLVHALEHQEHTHQFMRELWRVLAPGGRLLVIVPNRLGVWAKAEHTPFGHGKPYSANQLRSVLEDCMFTPRTTAWDLHFLPTHSRPWLRAYKLLDRLGKNCLKPCGGVVIMEAEKQLYAPAPSGSVATSAQLKTVADGGTDGFTIE